MPFRYSPSKDNDHSEPSHLYWTPVFRLVVYVSPFSASLVLASKTISHFDPVHSMISFSLATKSVLSAFFQASGPSVLSASPIEFKRSILFVGILTFIGFVF